MDGFREKERGREKEIHVFVELSPCFNVMREHSNLMDQAVITEMQMFLGQNLIRLSLSILVITD